MAYRRLGFVFQNPQVSARSAALAEASQKEKGTTMTRTLKTLALGVFAGLTMSVFAVLGASANEANETGGHFSQDSGGVATLHGQGGNASNTHSMHLNAYGPTVTCNETYTGSINAAKVTSVTITALYTECVSGEAKAQVIMNGCTYTFTVRQTNSATKHSPAHLICGAGKKVEVVIPGQCLITFGAQTVTAAVVYKRVVELLKHAVTAEITASGIKYEKHGLCEFVFPFGTGPHGGAVLVGTAAITGTNAAKNPINITATGTDGK